MSLSDGNAKALYGHGVFRTNVDIALLSAAGVTCYGHSFKYGVGISLKDGSVHESARVTFISVTTDVLDRSKFSGC